MKKTLLYEVNRTLGAYSKGTFKHRKTMQKVLINIISDLLDLKIAPPGFKYMTESHITHLVDFWKHKGYASATIINRLGILRNFNRQGVFNINIPKNSDLHIHKAKKNQSYCISDEVSNQVKSPIAAIVLKMQLEFGLTKYEAIRLPLKRCIMDSDITIPSKIAYNRKQRIITMYKLEQQEIIKAFLSILGKSTSLGSLASDKHIAQLYNAELALLKIDYNANFRTIYANKRLKTLIETGLEKEAAYKLLMDEMGYTQKYMLLKVLQ